MVQKASYHHLQSFNHPFQISMTDYLWKYFYLISISISIMYYCLIHFDLHRMTVKYFNFGLPCFTAPDYYVSSIWIWLLHLKLDSFSVYFQMYKFICFPWSALDTFYFVTIDISIKHFYHGNRLALQHKFASIASC